MPRKSQRSVSQSTGPSLTQQNSQKCEENTNINHEDQINDLVRYFVNRAGEHVIFKRAELKKNVLPKAGQYFQDILNSATKVLKEIYGYNIIVVDEAQNSTKGFIVTNNLPYIHDPTENVPADEYPEDVHKILTLLILSHIFMSNNTVSDNSLYTFLKTFGIDVERRHDIFGNVKEFINGTLKNKKYVNMEMDQMSKKISFSWGSRAEKEISKHEVLKFVCKMYKTTLPSSWISQYKSANEQHFENEAAIIEDIATQEMQE